MSRIFLQNTEVFELPVRPISLIFSTSAVCSFMLSCHRVARASTKNLCYQCDGANGDEDNMNAGWGPLSLWTDTFGATNI